MSRSKSSLQDHYAHEILSEIATGHPVSQRSLASRLGIALGMTNLLLKRLVRKGLVRVSRLRANRVAYFLTPSGMAEKARMSHAHFLNSVRLYATARDRIRASFEALSRDWPGPPESAGSRPIVFVGTGEVAEIAYVCLQDLDLTLVGVVDFQGRVRFFGVPVYSAVPVSDELRQYLALHRPVIVAFSDGEQVRRFLEEASIGPEQVHWV